MLTSWQKFRECQIYGWIHRETGKRRFRKAFTEVGRKNAKSQVEAGEALYELAITSTQNNETNELADKLCEVTAIMADIIRKQQAVIEMHGIKIEDPVLNHQVNQMDEILDRTELVVRK